MTTRFAPTSAVTVDLWRHLREHYNSTVVAKDKSAVMKAAAVLLDTLNIQDRDQFMQQFVTTLYRTIYVPFAIGDEGSGWSLWSQIRVAVHEHQHIEQGDRDGWPTFSTRYLTSGSWRASYEAEAYGSDLEMDWWYRRGGFDLSKWIGGRVQSLKSYGCKQVDIDMAENILSIRAKTVRLGGIETQGAQLAVSYLEARTR